jgi:hypothetical protein
MFVCGGGVGGLESIKTIQEYNPNTKITLIEPNKLGGCCSTYHRKNNNISDQAIFYYGSDKNDYNLMIHKTKDLYVNHKIDLCEIWNVLQDVVTLHISGTEPLFMNNPKSKTIENMKNMCGTNVKFNLPIVRNLGTFTHDTSLIETLNNWQMKISNTGFALKYIDDINAQFLEHYKQNISKCNLIANCLTKIDVDKQCIYLQDNSEIQFDNLILTMRINQIKDILTNSNHQVFNKLLYYLKHKLIFLPIVSYVVEIEPPSTNVITCHPPDVGILYGSINKGNLLTVYNNAHLTKDTLRNYCKRNNFIYKKLLHKKVTSDYSPICVHDKYYDKIQTEIQRIYQKTKILIPLGTLFAREGVYFSMVYHKKIVSEVIYTQI